MLMLCFCTGAMTSSLSSVCVARGGEDCCVGLDKELYLLFCSDSMYSTMLCRRGMDMGWLTSADGSVGVVVVGSTLGTADPGFSV